MAAQHDDELSNFATESLMSCAEKVTEEEAQALASSMSAQSDEELLDLARKASESAAVGDAGQMPSNPFGASFGGDGADNPFAALFGNLPGDVILCAASDFKCVCDYCAALCGNPPGEVILWAASGKRACAPCASVWVPSR